MGLTNSIFNCCHQKVQSDTNYSCTDLLESQSEFDDEQIQRSLEGEREKKVALPIIYENIMIEITDVKEVEKIKKEAERIKKTEIENDLNQKIGKKIRFENLPDTAVEVENAKVFEDKLKTAKMTVIVAFGYLISKVL